MSWKVEVKRFRGDDRTGMLLENLRYASVVSQIETEFSEDGNKTYFSFSVYAPEDVLDKTWADMNAKRMRSFRINAEAKEY